MTIIIMLVLSFIVLGRIFYKIKEFDAEMDRIYQDELNKEEQK